MHGVRRRGSAEPAKAPGQSGGTPPSTQRPKHLKFATATGRRHATTLCHSIERAAIAMVASMRRS
jgi:hypothetical protein